MLQNFRDFANKKIVRWIFVLFLVVPFGLFGIDAYFTRTAGGGDTGRGSGQGRPRPGPRPLRASARPERLAFGPSDR